MKINEIGTYEFTEDVRMRGPNSSVGFIKGRKFKVTQINKEYRQIHGPDLPDWQHWNIPCKKVRTNPIGERWYMTNRIEFTANRNEKVERMTAYKNHTSGVPTVIIFDEAELREWIRVNSCFSDYDKEEVVYVDHILEDLLPDSEEDTI